MSIEILTQQTSYTYNSLLSTDVAASSPLQLSALNSHRPSAISPSKSRRQSPKKRPAHQKPDDVEVYGPGGGMTISDSPCTIYNLTSHLALGLALFWMPQYNSNSPTDSTLSVRRHWGSDGIVPGRVGADGGGDPGVPPGATAQSTRLPTGAQTPTTHRRGITRHSHGRPYRTSTSTPVPMRCGDI